MSETILTKGQLEIIKASHTSPNTRVLLEALERCHKLLLAMRRYGNTTALDCQSIDNTLRNTGGLR